MDVNFPGNSILGKFNLGVAGAKCALGICYEHGIGVEKDFEEAAKWYRKAMENGIGEAAYRLGNMYFEGRGVDVDEKYALRCWKKGVELRNAGAAFSMGSYYINQIEPEMAMEMFKFGKSMDTHHVFKLTDEELDVTIKQNIANRNSLKSMVLEFEMANNLNIADLTFWQRYARALEGKTGHLHNVVAFAEMRMKNTILPSFFLPLPTSLKELEEKKAQGSKEASKILLTQKNILRLNDIVKNMKEVSMDLLTEVVVILYECELPLFNFEGCILLEVRKILRAIIAALYGKTSVTIGIEDEKARLCHLRINLWTSLLSSKDITSLEVLQEGVRRYPSNVYYHICLTYVFGQRDQFQEGLLCADKALGMFPTDPDFLYLRALHLYLCEGSKSFLPKEAFEKFIENAPRDHPRLPEAYYRISSMYLPLTIAQTNDATQYLMDYYFQLGKEAEKDQLLNHDNYPSDVKTVVTAFVEKQNRTSGKDLSGSKDNVCSSTSQKTVGVLKRKAYLNTNLRKVLQFRTKFKISNARNPPPPLKTNPPKLHQTVVEKLSTLKPLFLMEMNPSEDKIFENRMIELKIIDDPNPIRTPIHLLAEDENGDCIFLFVYNVDRDRKTINNFQVGCRIAIMNPFLRIGNCPINSIRVDEPKCIVYLKKAENVCRFCGEENAVRKCSKCKRLYCSRECQELDWREMRHKLICPIRFNHDLDSNMDALQGK